MPSRTYQLHTRHPTVFPTLSMARFSNHLTAHPSSPPSIFPTWKMTRFMGFLLVALKSAKYSVTTRCSAEWSRMST